MTDEKKKLTAFETIYLFILSVHIVKRNLCAKHNSPIRETGKAKLNVRNLLYILTRMIEKEQEQPEWGFSDYKKWLIGNDVDSEDLCKELEEVL